MTPDQAFIVAILTVTLAAIPSIIAAVKGVQNGQQLKEVKQTTAVHTSQLADVQQKVSGGNG